MNTDFMSEFAKAELGVDDLTVVPIENLSPVFASDYSIVRAERGGLIIGVADGPRSVMAFLEAVGHLAMGGPVAIVPDEEAATSLGAQFARSTNSQPTPRDAGWVAAARGWAAARMKELDSVHGKGAFVRQVLGY